MFDEKICIKNLKRIVSEHADDEYLKKLTLDKLQWIYTKIAEHAYFISVFNCHKYKNMLWNLDNLRPEIRSRFQTELFNTWHSIDLKSVKADLPEDNPVNKVQSSTPSPTAASKASARQYENDWFDNLLSFFAAVVGAVSKTKSNP